MNTEFPEELAANRRARKSDPTTSHAAAESVEQFASGHAALIYRCLVTHGALTVDEIAHLTGLRSQQVNKRTSEMKRTGLLTLTGETRLSDSGREERVWMVAP